MAEEYHFLYSGSSMKLKQKLSATTMDTAKITEQVFSLIPVTPIIIFGITWVQDASLASTGLLEWKYACFC